MDAKTPDKSRTIIVGAIHLLLLILSAYMASKEKTTVDVPVSSGPPAVYAPMPAREEGAPAAVYEAVPNFTTVTINAPCPTWHLVFMVVAFAAFPLYFVLRLITKEPMRLWKLS